MTNNTSKTNRTETEQAISLSPRVNDVRFCHSKTIRLNIIRATVIKLAIENYEEISKLNLTEKEQIELLTIKSVCNQVIGTNKSHYIDTSDIKVMI